MALVPTGTSARVQVDPALGDVNAVSAWERVGGWYVSGGDGNQLTITVEMGAGTLHLVNE